MPSTHTNLLYHVIFSTKCRIPLITKNIQDELYRYIGGIIHNEGGSSLEIGGTLDHIHLLAKFKPVASVSEMLARIKANSSKWANDNKRNSESSVGRRDMVAFSVSESQVQTVSNYIRGQEDYHCKQTYQVEYCCAVCEAWYKLR